jgi:hypothetical protein
MISTADVETLSTLFSALNSIARNGLSLIPDPGNGCRILLSPKLGSAFLRFRDPVVQRPLVGLFLFLLLSVLLIGIISSTDGCNSSEETSTDLELLLSLVIDIVPVFFFFLFGGLDSWSWVRRLISLLVLVLLVLLFLLVPRGVVRRLAILSPLAGALVVRVVSVTTSLHTSPESGSHWRSPIALGPVGLDEFVVHPFEFYDVTGVVIFTRLPSWSHFVQLR